MQLGAAAAAAPALVSLVGCGGGSKAVSCMDTSGLQPAQIRQRGQFAYVDVSEDPAKTCENCALFTAPAEGAACGSCSLVPGTIAPKGSCTGFAPKA